MITPSQKKTLEILSGLNGGPATAQMIQAAGGYCASLPELIRMGLVKEKPFGIDGKIVRVWSATTTKEGSNEQPR